MESLEQHHEEWERIRTRADTLANAIFLISGGALSVSISVMISEKQSGVITSTASGLAVSGWYFLLGAIILFLVLKAHMVAQAFLLHEKTKLLDKYYKIFNAVCWLWGLAGFVSFVLGLVKLVGAASAVVGS